MSREQTQIIEQQNKAVYEVSRFFGQSSVDGFDSLNTEHAPQVLKDIFDAVDTDFHKDIFDSVGYGIEQYKAKNGGEMPNPNVLTAALYAAKQAIGGYKETHVFDDITNIEHETNAIVPSLAVTTIAAFISQANPAVAYIPNINGSNLVPIVAARYVADRTRGAMVEGDYIDGENASLPYVDSHMKFAMALDTGSTYEVISRVAYANYDAKTPDATTDLAPFLPNHVSIRVNGVEVAHSRQRREEDRKGTFSLLPTAGVTIGATTYTVTGSTVDFDTHEIVVTFSAALPVGVKAYAHVVLDFERKDANKINRLLPLAGLSLKPEYGELLAAPVSFGVSANINTLTQLANELNVSLTAAAMMALQSKYYLEQTIRLLSEGRDRAIAQGRSYEFDASRGVTGNLSAAYNETGQLIKEALKTISYAQLVVKQAAGGATGAFDLYVGDTAAVFMRTLMSDFFKTTNAPYAGYGEIVRIGTLNDGTNVYHAPNASRLCTESDKTSSMLLVGRGNEVVRNPFVGHIASPMQVLEAKRDPLEINLAAHARIAADVNPIGRYADQVAVINMINLPSIGI